MEFRKIIELVPLISLLGLQLVFDVETTKKQPPDAVKQDDTTQSMAVIPTTDFSIESLIFPEAGLRVWHIAALAISLVLIIIVIICCCIDFRIPRTVQQIEETDRKLKLNKQYIKELSRAASPSRPAPSGRVTYSRRETPK